MSSLEILDDIAFYIDNSIYFDSYDGHVVACKEDILDYIKDLKQKLEDEL